jgi:hypothetical protein
MDTIQREFTMQQAFPGTLNNGTVFVSRSDVLPTQLSNSQP